MSRLREQVYEFQAAFGVTQPETPTIPPDERVRVRLRLIAEEFLELVEASLAIEMRATRHYLFDVISHTPIKVDLPEFADACADLDYVVEGSRLEFGIDGGPIRDAVHASNMAKAGGPVVNGKIPKPAGWSPPDVAGLLREQGWRP